MAEGSLLKRIRKVYANNPAATEALNRILNNTKKDKDDDHYIIKVYINGKMEHKTDEKVYLERTNRQTILNFIRPHFKIGTKFLDECDIEVSKPGSNNVIKVRLTQTNVAKNKSESMVEDGSKVSEVKRGRMNNDISYVLKKIKSQKLANDDSELIKTANRLKDVNVNELEGEKIYACVKDLEDFYKAARVAMSEFKGSPLVGPIEDIIQVLSKVPKSANLAKISIDEEMAGRLFAAKKIIENESNK